MSMIHFTLRDLFWATLVVGLGLGWWLHVRRLERELASTQSDLLYQADLVYTFADVLTQLGCEMRESNWPSTGIFYSEKMRRFETGMLSSTQVPREQLQRALDDEFGKRFRDSPSVQAARAATSNRP
jgi:hypothetical protein